MVIGRRINNRMVRQNNRRRSYDVELGEYVGKMKDSFLSARIGLDGLFVSAQRRRPVSTGATGRNLGENPEGVYAAPAPLKRGTGKPHMAASRRSGVNGLFSTAHKQRIPQNDAASVESASQNASRSGALRQRRDYNIQNKAEKSAYRAQYAVAAMPPVLTRAGVMGLPLAQHSSTRPRRRVAFSLRNTGAELVLPSIPIVNPGWRLLSGFLTLILGAMIVMAFTSSEFIVGDITINGLKRLEQKDIEKVVKLEGSNILMVEPEKVQKTVADAFPELKDVSVSLSLPGSIQISAVERKPVIAWKYKDITSWIDAEGVLFPERGDGGSLLVIHGEDAPPMISTVPVDMDVDEISANPTEETEDATLENSGADQKIVDPTIIHSAVLLRKKLPKKASIVYKTSDGMGWNDPGGWKVYLGRDLNNLDEKLKVYQSIIKQLQQQGVTPTLVSVAFINAPFYRVE